MEIAKSSLSKSGDSFDSDGTEDLTFVYEWLSVLLYDGYFQSNGDVTYFKGRVTEN
jgi:hypothetical protein